MDLTMISDPEWRAQIAGKWQAELLNKGVAVSRHAR
jgi:hypothetical protein